MFRSRIIRAAVTALAFGALALQSAVAASAATVATDSVQLHGHIVSVHGDTLNLRLRDGQNEKVDISQARAKHHTGIMPVGGAVVVYGSRGKDGVFHAVSIGHTNPDPRGWPPDD